MDYKQASRAINWHTKYSKMNGSEMRVFCFMATEANYKDKTIAVSYSELAKQTHSSKPAVIKAIKALKEFGSIGEIKKAVGTGPTIYKIRTEDELNILYKTEKHSDEWSAWDIKREELFDDVDAMTGDVYQDAQECEECKDFDIEKELYCARHAHELKQVKDTSGYKHMLLWLSDNPEPPLKESFINGFME